MRRLTPAAVAAALLAAAARPAPAQVQYRPSPGNLPPSQTQATAQPTFVPPASPAPVPTPYPIYGGYPGYPTIQGPTAGYLNGVANVTNAYGQYQNQINQARLTNQQVEQEKIRTRRMFLEQRRYEQSLIPTAEDLRRQRQILDLRRALNDPPLTEILNGDALNTLLKNVQELQSRAGWSGVGPTVLLDREQLDRVHVTGGGGGSVAAFGGGKLKWPYALRRARNDPPSTEIWSGTTLNALFSNIRDARAKEGLRGPLVPLSPDLLKHINLTAGTSRGPSTMVRASKLRWPLPLQEDVFTEPRDQINQLMQQATKEARENDQQLKTFKALGAAVDELKGKIDTAAPNMPLGDIIRAQRFTDQLSDSVRLLRDPMAANYFNGKWQAQGNSVGELVDYMIANGLSFVAAGEEDRPAYTTLYQAFLTYDSGLRQYARR